MSTVSHAITPFAIGFAPLAMSKSNDDASGTPAMRRQRVLRGPRDDLPYQVELWNEDRSGVERVLAATANSSIGYAAYHAATREYPGRYVTLRHRNRIFSRWNA